MKMSNKFIFDVNEKLEYNSNPDLKRIKKDSCERERVDNTMTTRLHVLKYGGVSFNGYQIITITVKYFTAL